MNRVVALDPATYTCHSIHGDNRLWTETNCYSDVVIELLHGLGHEPIAALAFTLGIDFEGDQWTFFKFPDADLLQLYGLDIQELAVWRPIADHISDQIAAGRPVMVELDSFFLPDTAGSAYKIAHVKSTVAVNEIDVESRHMGYFHNSSYHSLGDADFVDIFQLEGLAHERMLPPYIEFVKKRAEFIPLSEIGILEMSLQLLKKHLALVPTVNPFHRFKARIAQDLTWLLSANIESFHTYSFANLRQYGACFELCATYMRWLKAREVKSLDTAADAFQKIAESAKAFQFQLARSVARKRELDLSPIDSMAIEWDRGMHSLKSMVS